MFALKCVLCGQPTGKLFGSHHQDCVAKFKTQWFLMARAIDEYNLGIKSWPEAKYDFINFAAENHVQKFFWGNIHTRSEVRTYDKLIFSQSLICAGEEKNRCHMERTGLSYEKYPQWDHNYQCIAQMGTVALSDSGIYIIGIKTYYIPYGKIVDVGMEKLFWGKEKVYFDVHTTSANRHRYLIESEDKKDKNLVVVLYEILRFMTGMKDAEFKNHLINTPPNPIEYMFHFYPSDANVEILTEASHTGVRPSATPPKPTTIQNAPTNNTQRHRWTIEEDALCCRRFFEQYVSQQGSMDLYQFVQQLQRELPDIPPGSLRMKTQNIKQLCVENGIRNSLDAKPLAQYSQQNYRAFLYVKKEFGF